MSTLPHWDSPEGEREEYQAIITPIDISGETGYSVHLQIPDAQYDIDDIIRVSTEPLLLDLR